MEHKIFALYTMQARSNFKTVSIPGDGAVDVRRFWGISHKRIKDILQNSLTELGSMKVSILVQAQLEKDGEHVTAMLRSKSLVILESTDIRTVYFFHFFQLPFSTTFWDIAENPQGILPRVVQGVQFLYPLVWRCVSPGAQGVVLHPVAVCPF